MSILPRYNTIARLTQPILENTIAPVGINTITGDYVISVPQGSYVPAGAYSGINLETVRKQILERKQLVNTYKNTTKKATYAINNVKRSGQTYRNLASKRNEYKKRVRSYGVENHHVPKMFVNEKLSARTSFLKTINKRNKLMKTAKNTRRKACGWKWSLLSGWKKPAGWKLPPGVEPEECMDGNLRGGK